MAKTFKEVEKQIAVWLSRDGVYAQRKAATWQGVHIVDQQYEDIDWGAFSVEVKSRKQIPQYIHDWMRQAVSNCQDRIPFVVWHQDWTQYGKEYVILYLEDFYKIAMKYMGKEVNNET